MSNWKPDPEGLSQIVSLLRESQSPNPQIQKQIHEYFQNFSKVPDFCNYLVYVFAVLRSEANYVRSCAGLLLKNNVKEHWKNLGKEVQEYIKVEIIQCLTDAGQEIRRTAASIITTICDYHGLENWPNLLPSLAQLLDSNDLNGVDGAFLALSVLCEDHPRRMDSEKLGRPLNVFIPKFLSFFRSPHASFRKYALTCMNQFLTEMPAALLANMETYIAGIYFLTNDPTPQVRRRVCQALTTIVEIRIDYLQSTMRMALDFILSATRDPDQEVALEACEFWNSILEQDTRVATELLQEYLHKLVPALLERMAYSPIDLASMGPEVDQDVPDNPQDIKPFISKSKKGASMGTMGTENGEDGDSDTDDDDNFAEEVSEWTVRKCAASALDACSDAFRDQLLPVLLPLIQERLNNLTDWKVRETAVLSLGAIARGCFQGLVPHLSQLVPYLIGLLNDPQPLIRSITCWTLSRYSHWVVMQEDSEKYLRPLMIQLLNRLVDQNKKVQEAACSAFACLEEEAQSDLIPYLQPILQCLVAAYEKYQAKNLYILYDCIGTLADAVGAALNKPEYVNTLMPPLTARWNKLQDEDRDLLPLLECLTSIAAALGVGFQQYAQPVFQRCLRLIEKTLMEQQLAEQQQAPHPDKDFLISGLDLISGLAEGLQTSIESLVANSNLVSLLYATMKENRTDVLQSAFALCGDLAKHCIVHIRPILANYLPILIDNLTNSNVAVSNNASWAIGEIAMKIGDQMGPYVPSAMQKLVTLLRRPNLNRSLLQNTAITIGRLGYVCPEVMAPQLEQFVENWCIALLGVKEDQEKESACRGLVKMIKLNPNGVVKNFVAVCDVIVSWEVPPPNDLRESFFQILHGFKNSMQPQQWARYIGSFPEHIVRELNQKYQI